MKKQFAIIALGLIMGATVLDSCKKGENDPGISFRSRKGRMAGDWKVTKGEGKETTGSNYTETWTYDGTTQTSTVTMSPFPPATTSTTYTEEYMIEKDGSFMATRVETQTNNTQTTTTEGTWNFTGKVGEDKNKDHVVFRVTKVTVANTSPASSSTYTYTGDDCPAMVMYIDRLSNKEVVLKYNGTSTDPSGTVSTKEETWTWEPK